MKVKALARTYVQRTQGTLLSMNFNTSTAFFEAVFTLDTSIQAPTEVYLNQEYWYQKQYKIKLFDHHSSKEIHAEIKNVDNYLLSFKLRDGEFANGS